MPKILFVVRSKQEGRKLASFLKYSSAKTIYVVVNDNNPRINDFPSDLEDLKNDFRLDDIIMRSRIGRIGRIVIGQ